MKVRTYREAVAALGPLTQLPPAAFLCSEEYPQGLCNLILSLALVYNDLRDVVLAHSLLDNELPADSRTPTSALGHMGGLQSHLVRIQAGVLQELLELLAREGKHIDGPAGRKVVKELSPAASQSWKSLRAASRGKRSKGALGGFLFFVRNKTVYHYDAKELYRGYAAAFVDSGADRVPYLSIANSMAKIRFYFADAAADTYMRQAANEAIVNEFFAGTSPILHDVNLALSELVTRYLVLRVGRNALFGGTTHRPRGAGSHE